MGDQFVGRTDDPYAAYGGDDEPAASACYTASHHWADIGDRGYSCTCCPDRPRPNYHGYGRYILHDTETDAVVVEHDAVRALMTEAGVQDGDEVEITVRGTGRRPVGDRLVVFVRRDGNRSSYDREAEQC